MPLCDLNVIQTFDFVNIKASHKFREKDEIDSNIEIKSMQKVPKINKRLKIGRNVTIFLRVNDERMNTNVYAYRLYFFLQKLPSGN